MFRPLAAALLFIALLTPLASQADEAAPSAQEARMETAYTAAGQAMQHGSITLRDQATLNLPEGYGYVPTAEARSLLEAMGNRVGDNLLGMVVPLGQGEANDWFMVVSYDGAGYIKDDDAKDWDADELLDSLKEGTEAANEDRRTQGIPEMEIVGWVEKPTYQASSQRLVWSLESRDKGQPDSPDNGINYNTLLLGREGYVSMNLVTDKQAVEGLKPVARNLLSSLSFNSGKRYADFNPDTDHVAEYGLAALVAGVAAKKLGLLAMAGVFFAKFAKLLVVGGIAGLIGLRKLFGGKGKETA